MSGESWRVLAALVEHVGYGADKIGIDLQGLVAETGMYKQNITKALATLRAIGILTPSQKWGEYHFSVEFLYRGHLSIRPRLLRQQREHRI